MIGDENSRNQCTPSRLMRLPDATSAISRSHDISQSNAHNRACRLGAVIAHYLNKGYHSTAIRTALQRGCGTNIA
jgi:hypothetical protein